MVFEVVFVRHIKLARLKRSSIFIKLWESNQNQNFGWPKLPRHLHYGLLFASKSLSLPSPILAASTAYLPPRTVYNHLNNQFGNIVIIEETNDCKGKCDSNSDVRLIL